MKGKILVAVVLAMVIGLAFAGTAGAQAQESEDGGRVWARGIGYAELHGSGRVDIAGHGAGVIVIKGAEALTVQGAGRRINRLDGAVLLVGWRGHVHVEGHDLMIKMAGGVIEFSAEGNGWVFLKGRGVYNHRGQQGEWLADGVRLEL